MNYNTLIETVSLIVETEKIEKRGLTLLYELPSEEHTKMNQDVFWRSNPYATVFEPSDEFEVMIGGILVKFKKLS